MNIQETKLYKSDENILTGRERRPECVSNVSPELRDMMEATRSGGGLHVLSSVLSHTLSLSLSLLSPPAPPSGALTSEEQIDKGYFKVVLDPREVL